MPVTRRRRSAPLGKPAPPNGAVLAEPAASREGVHANAGPVPAEAPPPESGARDGAEQFAVRRRRSRDTALILAGNTEHASRWRRRGHHAAAEQPRPVRRLAVWTTLQLLLGICFWAALGYLVYATDPSDSLARIAFFGALFGALFFTLSPLLRSLTLRLSRSRLYQEASGRHAARQAALLASFVILNAGMETMRSWSALNALLLFGTFAVIEVVALARR